VIGLRLRDHQLFRPPTVKITAGIRISTEADPEVVARGRMKAPGPEAPRAPKASQLARIEGGMWERVSPPHRGGVWKVAVPPSHNFFSIFELRKEIFGTFWD